MVVFLTTACCAPAIVTNFNRPMNMPGPRKPGDLFDAREYFVSAIDDARTSLLAGPFPTHGAALALVQTANDVACGIDPRAHWYAFGTCSLPAGSGRRGVLNGRLGF